MNKFRYSSPIGIIFIFLFLTNLTVVIASVYFDNSVLASSAILLALFQFNLHQQFQRKHTVWKNLSLKYFFLRVFPKAVQIFSSRSYQPDRSTQSLGHKRDWAPTDSANILTPTRGRFDVNGKNTSESRLFQ